MALYDYAFPWPVCIAGYEPFKKRGKAGKTIGHGGEPGLYIRPKGKRFRRRYPLQFNATAYLDFADLDGSPEACVGFADKHGMLTGGSDPVGETLAYWQRQIRQMRKRVQAWQTDPLTLELGDKNELKVGELDVILRASPPDGALALYHRPRHILAGMQLQLAAAVTEGLEIRPCEKCGKPITIGPGHRQSHAKFCTDKCRIDFNNRKKLRRARK